MLLQLPTPSADALDHSEILTAEIRQQIEQAGGWISFADYMNLALYAPGLGYYSAGAVKFGADGDFVTAPEISPLFSQCLAGQCAEVLQQLSGGDLLELGAGSGRMAGDMLLELDRLGQLPGRYLILETSAELRGRQRHTIEASAPALLDRVQWLDAAPTDRFRGVLIGNEVIDALPVDRFAVTGDGLQAVGVTTDADGLCRASRAAGAALVEAVDRLQNNIGAQLPAGYRSELSSRLPAWIAELGGWIETGAILFVDYGLPRREYYSHERSDGTLQCHYRHRAHEDPFLYPGLQDITAWVDFSLLAESATAAGFAVAGYTTQAQFLIAAGLEQRLAEGWSGDLRAQTEQAGQLHRLLLPGEMGESFKAMVLTRGPVHAPSAFRGKDLRRTL